MQFEWDETKNRANLRKHGFDFRKHGFDFSEAEEIFRGPILVRPDVRDDYGEERWIGIGTIRGRCASVAFASRSNESIRIISLRKADHEERKEYESAIQDGLETD